MLDSRRSFVGIWPCVLIALAPVAVAQQFVPSPIVGTYPLPNNLATADFDGDGRLDFAITYGDNPIGGTGEVLSVLANGTWGSRSRWFGFAYGMVTAELNGDGRPELLISLSNYPFPARLDVYSFSPRMQRTLLTSIPGVYGKLAWIRGDSDALPDLFAYGNGSTVSFLRHLGNGAFAPPVVTAIGPLAPNSDVLVADFDGDGIGDLAVIVRYPTAQVELRRGDGFGSFLPAVITPLPALTGWPASLAADLNQDGATDLVVETRVALAIGAGGFLVLPTPLAGPARATGDFNGDGRPDILAQIGLAVVPQLQQPGGTFVGSGLGFGMGSWNQPFVLDANQDGRLDIVVLVPQTSTPVPGVVAAAVLPHAVEYVWPIGIGTPGCRGHIALSANSDPTVGLAGFGITATNAPAGAPGILLAWPAGLLQPPIPEQPFGLGFTIHAPPLLAQIASFSGDAHGQAFLSLPIPATGLSYQFQAVWLAPIGDGACSESPLGLVSSNALVVRAH